MCAVIDVNQLTISYPLGNMKSLGLKEYALRKLKGQIQMRMFTAIEGVSFQLHDGDMLGIIGSNGAGKSTLLKVIAGIMPASGGSCIVKGNVAALLELATGFDMQMTVKENAYLRGAILGYSKDFMNEKYPEIIDFAELVEFQEFRFDQLSSGMKSRLAFSIACLMQPEILILDEVLSVGDGAFRAKSEKKMLEVIGKGVTTIFVSHSTDQIKRLCNKILWLDHGKQLAFSDDVIGVCEEYEDKNNKKSKESEKAPTLAIEKAPEETPILAIEKAPEAEPILAIEEAPETEASLMMEEAPEETPILAIEVAPEEEPLLAIEEAPEAESLLAIEEATEEESLPPIEVAPEEEPLLAIEDAPIEDAPEEEKPLLAIEEAPEEEPLLAIEIAPEEEPLLTIEEAPIEEAPEEESLPPIEGVPENVPLMDTYPKEPAAVRLANNNSDRLFLSPKYPTDRPLRLIHICLGQKNPGDALLFPATRGLFQNYIGPIEFRLMNLHEEYTEDSIRMINESDGLVIGGGGLLLRDDAVNDISGWQWACPEALIRKIKVPIIVYAIGYNKFRGQGDFDDVFNMNIATLVEKAAFFSLRNQGSIQSLKRHIPRHLHHKLRLAPDPTSLLSRYYPYKNKNYTKGKIALNIPFYRKNLKYSSQTAVYFNKINSALDTLRKEGFDIAIYNHLNELDTQVTQYIDFPDINLDSISPDKVIDCYQDAELVFGGRAHSQMIPFGLNRPVFSLITHNKLQWFLDDIERKDWGSDIFAEDIDIQMIDFIHKYSKAEKKLEFDMAQDDLWSITLDNMKDIRRILGNE